MTEQNEILDYFKTLAQLTHTHSTLQRKWDSYDWRKDKIVMLKKSIQRSIFLSRLKHISDKLSDCQKHPMLEIGLEKNLSCEIALKLGTFERVDREKEYRNVTSDYHLDFVEDDLPSIMNGRFSLVLASSALEHTYDVEKFISRAFSVLRPNGILIINTPYLHDYHCEPYDFWRITKHSYQRLLSEQCCEYFVLDDRYKINPLSLRILRRFEVLEKILNENGILVGNTVLAIKNET